MFPMATDRPRWASSAPRCAANGASTYDLYLAYLQIQCANPVGPPTVIIGGTDNSVQTVALADNGVFPDQWPNDGIHTAVVTLPMLNGTTPVGYEVKVPGRPDLSYRLDP